MNQDKPKKGAGSAARQRAPDRCGDCPFPATGFVCWGGGEECLRSRVRQLQQQGWEHPGKQEINNLEVCP